MKASAAVLLVEDDPDLREVMVEALELQRISAAVASNGAEALGYLRNAEAPKLILLDLMMPVMDGFQFRHEQRKSTAWSNIPVLVLSADREVEHKARALGVENFLRKPVDLHELMEIIHRFIQ